MTKIEQKRFIKDLCGNIESDIRSKIAAGKIPTEWDGHELRQLVADKAKEAASRVMVDNKRRRDEYENTVIVNNL